MKKIYLYSLCVIIFFVKFSHSYAIDTSVQELYQDFSISIERNYSTDDQYTILKKVYDTAKQLLEKNLKPSTLLYVNDLIKLNNESLYDIWLRKELDQSQQLLGEHKTRLALTSDAKRQEISNNITNLISSQREYIAINNEREFVKDGDIYRIEYAEYFPINSSSISALQSKQGIMVQENNQERFIENYSVQRKIPYSEISQSFAGFLTPTNKIVKKHGNYYAYNFSTFRFFEDTYGAYESQLEASGISKKSTFSYRDEDGKYNFVTDYTGHGVISEDLVFGIPEKHIFLDALRDDSNYPTTNIGDTLLQIQGITEDITNGKTENEKIESIYKWILENISYSEKIDLNDKKIFSAIETYKNKSGVCTGYAKLMLYMLLYAGIDDVEVIRGHVIDAPDFPDIGHAWVRIGEKYYDPTFDDPIGLLQAKTREQYKYFGLPRDIFYANRFEYDDLPEVFKTAATSQINEHIYTYLQELIPKYEGQLDEYKVFSPIIFRDDYNIGIHEVLSPELLGEKIGFYTIEEDSFKFIQDEKEQRISHIRYYVLDSGNTKDILEILDYRIDNLYLFDWEVSDGRREWRLAYEIEIR